MNTIVLENLEWQAEDDGIKRNWDEAIEYAKSLGNGWRLPNIKELMILIDYSKYNPATELPDMRSFPYWSSSTFANNSGYAWFVNFNIGIVDHYIKSDYFYVRCVRERR